MNFISRVLDNYNYNNKLSVSELTNRLYAKTD